MAKHKYSKGGANDVQNAKNSTNSANDIQNAAENAKIGANADNNSVKNSTNNVQNARNSTIGANADNNSAKNSMNNVQNVGNSTNGANADNNSAKNSANNTQNAKNSTANNASYAKKTAPTGRLSLKQKGEIVLNSTERVPVIDNTRGWIMLILLLLGFGMVSANNSFSSHSVLPGVGFRDLITPALMFTIAMSLNNSFRKRAAKFGVKAAKRHILTRGMSYIAVGLLLNETIYFVLNINGGDDFRFPSLSWDILPAVGAALITASFAVNMKNQSKILFMIGLLLFPIILNLIMPEAVNGYLYSASNISGGMEIKWGGIFSFFGFGAMLIAYDILTQLAFKDIKKFLIAYVAIVAVTAVCIVITPSQDEVLSIAVNTGIVDYAVKYLKNPFIVNFITLSLGYLFVGTAVGASAILIAVVLNYINDKDYFVFAAVGRNSLLFYLIFVVLSRFIAAFVKAQSVQNGAEIIVPWYVPLTVSIAATAAMCVLAEILDRKKIYLKL